MTTHDDSNVITATKASNQSKDYNNIKDIVDEYKIRTSTNNTQVNTVEDPPAKQESTFGRGTKNNSELSNKTKIINQQNNPLPKYNFQKDLFENKIKRIFVAQNN